MPEKPTPAQHRNQQQNSLCDPHSNPLPAIYHPYTALSIMTVKSMGFLDYDVEMRKIICSTNAIESLNAHHDAPGEPADTSPPSKLRSSAATSSPA